MRYLILSDIHSNWEALEAVLADAEGLYEQILNCGDLVGYGADPNRVVDWVRSSTSNVVRGNHDKACASLQGLDWFNPAAQASAIWTHETLTPENLQYLAELPQGPMVVDDFQIFHGMPHDEDEYLIDLSEARTAAEHIDTRLAFFGHTHIQITFQADLPAVGMMLEPSFRLQRSPKYLVNPGSVGQPRDHDPRAGYALYDSDKRTVVCRRVDYDIPEASRKIGETGMPDVLGRRLFVGV